MFTTCDEKCIHGLTHPGWIVVISHDHPSAGSPLTLRNCRQFVAGRDQQLWCILAILGWCGRSWWLRGDSGWNVYICLKQEMWIQNDFPAFGTGRCQGSEGSGAELIDSLVHCSENTHGGLAHSVGTNVATFFQSPHFGVNGFEPFSF